MAATPKAVMGQNHLLLFTLLTQFVPVHCYGYLWTSWYIWFGVAWIFIIGISIGLGLYRRYRMRQMMVAGRGTVVNVQGGNQQQYGRPGYPVGAVQKPPPYDGVQSYPTSQPPPYSGPANGNYPQGQTYPPPTGQQAYPPPAGQAPSYPPPQYGQYPPPQNQSSDPAYPPTAGPGGDSSYPAPTAPGGDLAYPPPANSSYPPPPPPVQY